MKIAVTLQTILMFFFGNSFPEIGAIPSGLRLGCITCNRQLQTAIWNSTFVPNLAALLSPFVVLALVVGALAHFSSKRYDAQMRHRGGATLTPVPLTTAAMVLGIGLGGFVDGIVLHQILQWHEMLSAKIPPVTLVAKSVNMFWDGIFHLATLGITITGIYLVWKLLQRRDIDTSGRLAVGGMLAGWGAFNIIEGLMDHHILKLHNVREISANVEGWNWGFLIFSLLLLFTGWRLVAARSKEQKGSS